jgi:type I pantothenate kinase
LTASPEAPRELLDLIIPRLGGRNDPLLVGIAGAVCAGKTTLAAAMRAAVEGAGFSVVVLGTDSFLFPNEVLAQRGLTYRKGFPESFDTDALVECLSQIRAGANSVDVPVYSHVSYDIVGMATVDLRDAALVIVEGVNALQAVVVEHVDIAVYLEADEADLADWFVTRFGELCAAGAQHPGSFYAAFAHLSTDEQRSLAHATWDAINLVNLREHITATRRNADVVVVKGPDHSVARVVVTPRPQAE